MDAYLKFSLVVSGGALFGTLVWLWTQFGTDVILAYAQDILLMCF